MPTPIFTAEASLYRHWSTYQGCVNFAQGRHAVYSTASYATASYPTAWVWTDEHCCRRCRMLSPDLAQCQYFNPCAYIGLTESVVVCSYCTPDLLAAKTRGIREAMRRLVNFIGADVTPGLCHITFHLDGDSYCGNYVDGLTGSFTRDADGFGHVCLWDVEKKNRSLPFTVENAQKIEDQMLPVHEAMHGWFVGRQDNYRIQEPFCKLMSFIISESPGGPEYCNWFESTPGNHPDVLMKYLCEIGMNSQRAAQVLTSLAQSASASERALSDSEFASIVTNVLGRDAVPAFRSAGIEVDTLVEVPDVLEMRQDRAAKVIRDAGLVPKFTGPVSPRAWVWRQTPPAGQTVKQGSTETLTLRTGPIP